MRVEVPVVNGDADDDNDEEAYNTNISSTDGDNIDEADESDSSPSDLFDAATKGNNLPPLTVRETFNLSAKFSLLWFISNYFNAASLQYTSVASCTILSSTSSVFILIFGAIFRIEQFTVRKLTGVLASLIGVGLISKADSAAESDASRGSFPYKSPGEIAIGDSMALFAAMAYGIYAVALVKTVGDESRVKMPLFFGFIGICNVVCLWPGLAILHWTGVETFQMPPNSQVWAVVLVNAGFCLIADVMWAYSMLFISPLVVTVGLSLSIPLSLLGQIALNSHWASPLYFVGAVIVLLSFIFINHESNADPQHAAEQPTTR